MLLQIISPEELETLIYGGQVRNMYSEQWLSIVRMLPCMYPGCNVRRAGTAHHLYNWGLALTCSDYLTIPLCWTHHVWSNMPVQQMDNDEFEKIMKMEKADAARRIYTVNVNILQRGDLV